MTATEYLQACLYLGKLTCPVDESTDFEIVDGVVVDHEDGKSSAMVICGACGNTYIINFKTPQEVQA